MPIGKVLANLRPTVGGRRRRKAPGRKAPARKPSMSALRSMLMGAVRPQGGRKRLPSLAPKATMGGRRRMGRGWLDTIKSGFNTAKNFVKDNRLISKGIRMIPGKYSDVAAQAAELAGYGRRRRAPRRMGRGWWDTIKSGFNTAKDFVKDQRLISKGIRMIPGKYSDVAAQAAELAGYGRRRRAPRVGGRIIMPAFYSTGLGGLAATA